MTGLYLGLDHFDVCNPVKSWVHIDSEKSQAAGWISFMVLYFDRSFQIMPFRSPIEMHKLVLLRGKNHPVFPDPFLALLMLLS